MGFQKAVSSAECDQVSAREYKEEKLLFFFMKSINGIDIEELERRMRPGSWSQEGFLTEKQSLAQVIADDLKTLQKLGVNAGRIAEVLQSVLEKGAKSNHFRPIYISNLRVMVFHSRKMRTCPWAPRQFERCHTGEGVKYLTTEDFQIANVNIGENLRGTSLCVHLIRDHNFFGGPETVYRIDPEKAVHVLELEPARQIS